ncbi:uncharacterized protein LOC110973069 [Acanthaster planci]|uniref:Uncharacterized protein LOC110973069 n=1 Tax=Acanthaster planci TaxID=133434 RepID=A0A8B7XG63_ACAPL|nr:uncharacterized protein LOC110973069 [Acanthaster planci]
MPVFCSNSAALPVCVDARSDPKISVPLHSQQVAVSQVQQTCYSIPPFTSGTTVCSTHSFPIPNTTVCSSLPNDTGNHSSAQVTPTTPIPSEPSPQGRPLPSTGVGTSLGQPVALKADPGINQNQMLSSMLAASAGGISMEIPVFNGGNPSEFRCFEAMVEGCIRPLVHLSELQKYFIVRSKLRGQPKKDVLGFEHHASPFTLAMSTLRKLYGDIGILIRSKIEQITSWPKLAAHDSKGLVELASTVSALVVQLESAPEGEAELKANSTACVLYSRLPHIHQTAFLKAMTNKGVRNFSLADINAWLQETSAVARKKIQLNESLKSDPSPGHHERRQRGAAAYHTKAGNQAARVHNKPVKVSHTSDLTESRPTKEKKPFPKHCPYCEGEHWLSRCDKFDKLSSSQRIEWIKANRRCWRCARQHREGQECDLRKPCRECSEIHLTVLHDLLKQPGYGSYYSSFDPNLSVFYGDGSPWHPKEVSLKILPIILYGNCTSLTTYCLLDDGSNFSMMPMEAAEALQLRGTATEIPIATARDACTPCRGQMLDFDIAPLDDPDMRIHVSNVFSSPMLRLSEHSVPAQDLQRRWPHLQNLPLHDCQKVTPLLLLGSDRPDLVIPRESRFGPENAPVAVKTRLGWALQGPTMRRGGRGKLHYQSSEQDAVLHENVCRLWNMDVQMYTQRKQVTRSKQDQRAVDLLEAKSTFVEIGNVRRVATPLLWRLGKPTFSCPASAVLPSLKRNEQRLLRDPDLAKIHCGKIQELKEGGLVRTVVNQGGDQEPESQWYIPHHVVRQNDKSRLVFNCAFRYQGESLNEDLLPGPTLGSSLVGVLLRFRKHPVAICGDIKAMFHCVSTLEADKSMLRFLWKEPNSDREPEELEWNVLPFGTTCSPCCASFALQKHVRDNVGDPDVLRSVLEAFYVDNCLDGKPTVDEAKQLVEKLRESLGAGGFPIVKWASNKPAVVADLQSEARSDNTERWLNFSGDTPEEVALGPRWNFERDVLTYQLQLSDWPILTRRAVLSDVMRCSGKDPLGYLMPFMVRGKILVQELWKRPWGWDDEIPDEGEEGIRAKHLRWRQELAQLKDVSLPRCYTPLHFNPATSSYQLHVFTDASEKAYGAVGYLRVMNEVGEVSAEFVMARSRLAPKRVQTMPRLELMAAVSGAELVELLEDELSIRARTTCWSDSTTVLAWINSESCRYNRFVGARVAEVQRLTNHVTWRYVESQNNPADDLTRGLPLQQIRDGSRWHRPFFLLQSETDWPQEPPKLTKEEARLEVKPDFFTGMMVTPQEKRPEIDVSCFDTWDGLVEGYSKALYQSQGEEGPPFLSADDRSKIERLLFQRVQTDCFQKDLVTLSAGKPVSNKSRLSCLCPEYDAESQLIRVGGRLRRATELDSNAKHPIVLDPKHPVTCLLIQEADCRLGHGGADMVLADLRRRFWIIRGRQSIRSLQSRCEGCIRRRGKPSIPKMADLPPSRLRIGKPAFYSTGVDCFGPFTVSLGRRSEQRWGIIWKCMTTRAVYLDLLDSLDADAFLMAFNRFRSRRGTPHEVLCDNGTNFKGGLTELTKAFSEMTPSLQEQLAKYKVRFKFNPPSAPHFGGTWEREVRSVKNALYAILGNRTVSAAVLYTSLVEVEALLNSKPLGYVSSDVADPDPITPFTLLLGRPDHAPPQVVYPDQYIHGRRRWRQCQALMQQFWKEFVDSYLPSMQARQKWRKEEDDLAVGNVVLMIDPHQVRASWPLARIIEVLPGDDGRVRAVRVESGGRVYTRPVAKLIRLPDETEDRAEVADPVSPNPD